MNAALRLQVLAASLLVAACHGAQAQEWSYGVGGLPYPLQAAPGLRLAEHEVRVELLPRRVWTRTVLRNEGAATTLSLAFPESGETGEAGAFPTRGFLQNWRCSVDGKPVALKRFLPKDGLSTLRPPTFEDTYRVAWTLSLRLKPGQAREVRAQWSGGNASIFQGAPERGSLHAFRYDLRSTDTPRWKGRAGLLRVSLDTAGLSLFDELKLDLPGSRRAGSRVLWQARNVELSRLPERIGASWWPGVRHFRVNGRDPAESCLVVGQERVLGEYKAVYPQRRGRSIWIPLRLLRTWRSEAQSYSSTERRDTPTAFFGQRTGEPCAPTKASARISEALGSCKYLKYLGAAVVSWAPSAAIREASTVERGVTMVQLEPAVRAMGGSVRVERGVVEIRFKAA